MKLYSKIKVILSGICLFLSGFYFAVPLVSIAQTAPKIEWQKCLGGSYSEDSAHFLIGTSIIQTQDGYIIAGQTNSRDGNVAGSHGNSEAWLVELSFSGAILRQKCFGGSGDDGASCIIHTSDLGFAVLGWTNSNDGDVSGNHGGIADIWVLKLAFDWDTVWQKCIGGSGLEFPGSIIQTSDGGFAIGGYTTSDDEGFFNHGPKGFSDAYVVKLNSVGDLVWQRCYGGTGEDGGGTIVQTSDGGYVFAGVTNSNDSDVSGNHLDATNMPSTDVWLFKIDSLGKVEWQKCLGGTGSDYPTSFVRTSDGGFALIGATTSTDGDVVGHHLGVHNNSDIWFVKLDSSCNVEWQRCLGGSNFDGGYSLMQTDDGGYALCGTTESNNGDVRGFHSANGAAIDSSDVWVFKMDSSGFIQWQRCLGGAQTDLAFSMIQSKDRGFAVHGRTRSFDGDVSGNHGNDDMWVVKLSPSGDAVENSSAVQSNFAWVYPNPANDQAHLYLFQSAPINRIEFYNLAATQFFPQYRVTNNLLSFETQSLPEGTYLVRISYANNPIEEIRKFFHSN